MSGLGLILYLVCELSHLLMYADYYSEENLEDSEICDNFVGWFYVWRIQGEARLYMGIFR